MRLLFIVSFLFFFVNIFGQDAPKTSKKSRIGATDIAVDVPAPYDYEVNRKYKGIQIESRYLTMRDGTQIAIDIYLPKNRKTGEKIPALIRQTRYWRSPQIRFPFSLMTNGLLGRMGEMIGAFVENGYAIINVDVRGSGASFGSRLHPWTEDEIKDGAEIIDWVIQQDWCSGNVGSLGVSYGGTTAEFLGTNKHPNLKAVVLMFSLFDVYEDNAFPGGIHNQWFTEGWGAANERMDANKLPVNHKKASLLVSGVSKVKTPQSKKLLREAVAGHAQNRNVHDGAMTVDCRDDAPLNGEIESIDIFSPHNYINALNESGTAVYSYSGWMDGAYQHSAVKRYLNLTNPNNKLILGSWEHGGAFNTSPFAPSLAGFDHVGELIKFFDYHLKDIQNGVNEEASVHYFTVGAEKWQASDSWPPKNAKPYTLYFSDNKKLTKKEPKTKEKTSAYTVDGTTGSGDVTRWKAVNGKVKTAYMYHDWNERTKKYLSYQSPILADNLEMTGHALVDLHMSFSESDGSVFVYLEDVDENGKVTYVTEGILRASHRKIREGIYKDVVPSPSHLRADYLALQPNEKVHLQMDLLPTSYLFKKGHKVRISIGGCDKDHFELLYPDGYEMHLHYGGDAVSKVVLPTYSK